jgi:hypothetical protein
MIAHTITMGLPEVEESKPKSTEAIELWRLSPAAQRAIFKEMPFVRFLMPLPETCQGWKTSGKPGDRKCKLVAWYVYKSLRGTWRNYCWHHLRIEGLEGPNGERERVEGWLKRHGYIQ